MMQADGYDMVLCAVEAEAKRQGWMGCTVTQMLTVTTPLGRRIAYTSNMGDSPAAVMIIGGARAANGPKVFKTSCSHSWEDEDEMRCYLQSVMDRREKAKSA